VTDTVTHHREYTDADRKEMAGKGWALDDGSYPVATVADVTAAVSAYNLSSDKKPADKAHIIKRAKALGATDKLPADWMPATTNHADPGGVVTIPDVELVRVGNWASAMSGRVPITGDDLDDMVRAAQDSEIDRGPVKIGHVDPRFDGEPALGWISNVRRVGDRIVADLSDVPAKLAAVVKHAFPRRSVEIAWGVKTPGGANYKAALSGVALLGVTTPAVKGLADVVSRYSGPTNDADDRGTVTTVDGDDSERAVAQGNAIVAAAEYAATLDGDPAQGRAIGAVALLSSSGDLPQTVVDDGGNDKPQEGSVNDEQVREALGLAADVPVTDQMRTFVTNAEAAVISAADAEKAKVEREAADATAAADAAAIAEAERLAAEAAARNAPTAPGVLVDPAALELLQAQAAQGAEAMRRIDEQERETVLATALSEGKVGPASLDSLRTAWDRDKDWTKAHLSGLTQVFSTTTSFSAAPSTTDTTGDAGEIPDEAWKDFVTSLGLKK
jgi:hypothetical protein